MERIGPGVTSAGAIRKPPEAIGCDHDANSTDSGLAVNRFLAPIKRCRMAVYIVTYDLNKETKRPNIVGEIKKSRSWARLSESSYVIDTQERPEQVRARLNPYLDANDYCFVITLSSPWDGYGPKEVIDWLQARL